MPRWLETWVEAFKILPKKIEAYLIAIKSTG